MGNEAAGKRLILAGADVKLFPPALKSTSTALHKALYGGREQPAK